MTDDIIGNMQCWSNNAHTVIYTSTDKHDMVRPICTNLIMSSFALLNTYNYITSGQMPDEYSWYI